MKHHGSILKTIIEFNNIKVKDVADSLGLIPQAVYGMFKTKKMQEDMLILIKNNLGIDIIEESYIGKKANAHTEAEKLRKLISKQTTVAKMAQEIGYSQAGLYKKIKNNSITEYELNIILNRLGYTVEQFRSNYKALIKESNKHLIKHKYPIYGQGGYLLNEPKIKHGNIIHIPAHSEVEFLDNGFTDSSNEFERYSLPDINELCYSFEVKGQHMEPTLYASYILITPRTPIDVKDIKDGYVYAFSYKKTIMTHRISVSKDKKTLIIKSDSEWFIEREISLEDVGNIWVGKKYIGYRL